MTHASRRSDDGYRDPSPCIKPVRAIAVENLAAGADEGNAMQRMCPRDEDLVPFAALPNFALVAGSYDLIHVVFSHRVNM